MSFLLGVGIFILQNTKKLRQYPFDTAAAVFLQRKASTLPYLSKQSGRFHFRRSSDLYLKRGFCLSSQEIPMTGFRQRQNRSILTAPGARGLSPHSLVQPDSRLALPSGHGNNYSVKKQKRL
jgi:hypothetical protein